MKKSTLILDTKEKTTHVCALTQTHTLTHTEESEKTLDLPGTGDFQEHKPRHHRLVGSMHGLIW